MRVLFTGVFPYPTGSAAASRIDKYARGLKALGWDVRVLAAFTTSPEECGAGWQTSSLGVPYTCVLNSTFKNPTVHAYIELRRKLVNGVAMTLREFEPDVVFCYAQCWAVLDPIVRLCRSAQRTVLVEVNEWPSPFAGRWPLLSPLYWDREAFRRFTLRKASGVVTISRLYFRHVLSRGLRPILIPALGEATAVQPTPIPRDVDGFEVVYLSSGAPRDLLDTAVRAVASARRQGVAARLTVIGAVRGETRAELQALSEQCGVAEFVRFTGYVSDSELNCRLASAGALLTLRADTRETRACFPTRIPEYLASGRPTVLSAVGDIPLYFSDHETSLLVPPGPDPEPIAQAIVELASDARLATHIGRAGQILGLHAFAFPRHARRLAAFMERSGASRARMEQNVQGLATA